MSKLHKGGWCLLPVLVALTAGCDFPGKPKPDDHPVPANQVADFDALYRTSCSGCHGADGKLGPAPPLNDPTFLALVSNEDLLRVITNGRTVSLTQKSPMPAFGKDGPLTDAQIKVLAEGIKQRWPAAESVPRSLTLAGTGDGNKDEGLGVFAMACAGCHGDQGQGGVNGAINNQAFLALISDQALRRLVITGRPDLGMPDYKGKEGRGNKFAPLKSEEIDHLVALLASWRQGGPADGK